MKKQVIDFLLMLLWVYAAVSKLLAAAAFREQLYNQTFPHVLADGLYYALPFAELLAAGLLSFTRTQTAGRWLSLGLLSIFSGYIVLVLLHFWSRVPCSCGGILSHMGWQMHLFFNLFFIGLTIAALYSPGKAENLRKE